MNKLIYSFGCGRAEGSSSIKNLIGSKGANLAQMCILGLPIPPGFTISSSLCVANMEERSTFDSTFETEIKKYITKLEKDTKKDFGSTTNPLFLSVRSGAMVSMPGMMDTILNLGMNDQTVEALIIKTNNPCFAYDSYRRFLSMYGDVVLKISHRIFEEVFERYKKNNNIVKDSDMNVNILCQLIDDFKNLIKKKTGCNFETDPYTQLKKAIEAVWKSWYCTRAVAYRKINNINDNIGTAVNVQSMVFGNKGYNSATGVIFTRNPSNGNNSIFGEFLINAQGEDVVSGIRTPYPIIASASSNGRSLQEFMPTQYYKILKICTKLEKHFKDMQDIEFTIEEGKVYILQTRSGKRAAAAAIKIAVDMVAEGMISKEEAIMRIDPESLNQLLHTTINYSANPQVIAIGSPASPGASSGIIVFSAADVEEMSRHHEVILVRNDTSADDIKGMHLASGILTSRGGMTSHAAVVARGMGKPCVCGVQGLLVNEKQKTLTTSSGQKFTQGERITIDGSTGNVIIGDVQFIQPRFSNEFTTLLGWADQIKDLDIRANAETVTDASIAMEFGATGIGLCRTEHMLFNHNKILLVREMIIAQDRENRQQAINKLRPLQVHDFKELFKVMNGKPINVRLLDPPLHEFLPITETDKKILAQMLNIPLSIINNRLHALQELNPMLGHRGCRLGISYPEIYIMQVEAALDAIKILKNEQNIDSQLELMIPFISDVQELLQLKHYIQTTIQKFEYHNSMELNIKLGTMIELPRAALTANQIAEHVEYFSFGSNDLTQTTYGISRDDVNSFLPRYIEQKIFNHDPFIKIDISGVGELIKMAIDQGKKVNHSIALGVCGEHAGDPGSIDFFHKLGIDYISCSPYRIPIARLSAARSKIKSLVGI